jgi:hypothetical protein
MHWWHYAQIICPDVPLLRNEKSSLWFTVQWFMVLFLFSRHPLHWKHKNIIKKQQGWFSESRGGQFSSGTWLLWPFQQPWKSRQRVCSKTHPGIQLSSSCLGAIQGMWQAWVLVVAGNSFSSQGRTSEPAAKHSSNNTGLINQSILTVRKICWDTHHYSQSL